MTDKKDLELLMQRLHSAKGENVDLGGELGVDPASIATQSFANAAER